MGMLMRYLVSLVCCWRRVECESVNGTLDFYVLDVRNVHKDIVICAIRACYVD